MATTGPKIGGYSVVGIVLGLVAVIVTFFLAGEDTFPGSFYISRQALWDGGKYYVKWTFMLTLLTLVDVFAVPMIIIAGLRGLWGGGQLANRGEPPPTWDVRQVARRAKQVVMMLVVSVCWGLFTGAAVFKPESLSPIGFGAGLLLMLIPVGPLLVPAVLFDAMLPTRYVEGQIEALQIVQQQRNNSVAHLTIAGELIQTSPQVVAGLQQGMSIRLLRSGFFKSVLRLERMQ